MKIIKKILSLSILFIILLNSKAFAQFNQTQDRFNPNQNFQQNSNMGQENYNFSSQPNIFIKKNFDDNETSTETYYSKRRNKKLSLQGYDIFKNQNYYQLNQVQKGAIQDDYILGVGDEILIWLEGGINIYEKNIISRNGYINFTFTNPISALGRSFSEVKNEIEKRIENEFLETTAYISISNIKQISVTISGEVTEPGSYVMSGFSGIMDIIFQSGGIKKTGTLRSIKIIQNNKIQVIDLYEILFGLNPRKNLSEHLKDGAIIIVPPIGETIALDGDLAKPGIYEIKKNQESIEQFLEISGGLKSPEQFLIDRQRIGDDGFDEIELTIKKTSIVNNGDIFITKPKLTNNPNFIEVIGHAKFPTKYSLKKYPSLLSLIPNLNFLEDGAYDFGVLIKSKNGYRAENLWSIINNKKDIKLRQNDKIFIFNIDDLNFLVEEDLLNSLKSSVDGNNKFSNCKSVSQLRKNEISRRNVGGVQLINLLELFSDGKSQKTDFSVLDSNINSIPSLDDQEDQKINDLIQSCPVIFENNYELIPALIENSIIIRGNIKRPGFYPINIKSTNGIIELLEYLGIPSSKVIISPNKKIIDVLNKSVFLEGSVRFPVEVPFEKISKLSKLINNSRVLSNDAYPLFATITRSDLINGIKTKIVFNPQRIISKQDDLVLMPNDKVKIYSYQEIKKLTNDATTTILNDETHQSNNIEDNSTNNNTLLFQKSNFENDNISTVNNSFDNMSFLQKNYDNQSDSSKEKSNQKKYLKQTNLKNQEKDDTLNFFKNFLVEIYGGVISPGYYPVGGKVDLNVLINEAGGLTNHANSKKIEILNYDGSQNLENIVANGSSVFVPTLNYKNYIIKLNGEFIENKEIAFKEQLPLSSVINNIEELSSEAYLYFAILKRKFSNETPERFFAFSPQLVLNGLQDIDFKRGDEVIIYSNKEISNMLNSVKNQKYRLTPEIVIERKKDLISSGTINELILRLTYTINGAVAKPGEYLIAGISSLENLINIAGGFTSLADKNNINVVSPKLDLEKNVILENNIIDLQKINANEVFFNPGSAIKVSSLSNDLNLGFVEILGSVKQPGEYRILKSDSIFEMLKRSGGLNDDAYLSGMVFTRNEEKLREQKSIKKLRRELDKAISLALETQGANSTLNLDGIMSLRELAQSASDFEPIGRVVGDFNSINILKNTKIVSGDKIFIPNKPTSVSVVGEVMSPGSIIWDNNKSLNQYINLAAGFTQLADNKKIFLIKPNGQAIRHGGLWGAKESILPGTTIVIPRRVKLSSTLKNIESVTSIIYQLTLSLAGIESVLND